VTVVTHDSSGVDAALQQYRQLGVAVGNTLDLDAGMADITGATRYALLRQSVARVLDLEVGLVGALAVATEWQDREASEPIPRPRPAPRPRSDDQPRSDVQPCPAAQPELATAAVASGPAARVLAAREPVEVPEYLVARAMTGDRVAVADLISTIRPLVVRYCRARLGRFDRSSVSADDVAQEVCLAVLTALPGYRVQGRPFLAFVYGIASHKVIDAHRAATRNRSEPVSDVPDRVESGDGPEQHTLRVELSEEMGRLLEKLPEKQREILVLRVVVGLSAEETAEAVGSTPGAVRVAQHRALARLRKSMPEEEVV
jgi:RNA polymerase sigma-70 factor, ECF subfamily